MVDLLPEALQRWQAVETMAREHFQRSGFGEIRTPLLETTDLFCRGIGEGTNVVGKEMYSFQVCSDSTKLSFSDVPRFRKLKDQNHHEFHVRRLLGLSRSTH